MTIDDVFTAFLSEQDKKLAQGSRAFAAYAQTLGLLRTYLNSLPARPGEEETACSFCERHGADELRVYLRLFCDWWLAHHSGLDELGVRRVRGCAQRFARWLAAADVGLAPERAPRVPPAARPQLPAPIACTPREASERNGGPRNWWRRQMDLYRAGA